MDSFSPQQVGLRSLPSEQDIEFFGQVLPEAVFDDMEGVKQALQQLVDGLENVVHFNGPFGQEGRHVHSFRRCKLFSSDLQKCKAAWSFRGRVIRALFDRRCEYLIVEVFG